MAEKEPEKLDFVKLYNSETQQNEFLYNVIESCFNRLGLNLVGPVRYDIKAVTYAIYHDLDLKLLKAEIIQVLNLIEKIEMIYSYEDKDNIFLDKKPFLKEKVFFYQPFKKPYETEYFLKNRSALIQKILVAKINKRSTLYKVEFN